MQNEIKAKPKYRIYFYENVVFFYDSTKFEGMDDATASWVSWTRDCKFDYRVDLRTKKFDNQ